MTPRDPVAPAPFVSVIVPCRNEGRFIGPCLESILATAWPHDRLEVLVVDGASDDETRAEVQRVAARAPVVRLLDNPARIVPVALNLGVRAARGSVIVRMDAHCHYPPEYLPVLVSQLEATGADNVGAVCRTVAASGSATALGIAEAMAHPLGVGNAHFRLGITEPRWVDTVPFGCWRRDVFERIGGFDETLVRNQDDEFNHRLLASGGRILLVPGVEVTYYGRETLGQLGRMMAQYGLFKPVVGRKLGRVTTARQLAPAAFVAALVVGVAGAPWWTPARWLLAAVLAPYLVLLLVAGAGVARRCGWAVARAFMAAVVVMHVRYGAGYWRGIVRVMRPSRAAAPLVADLPSSRA